MIGKQERLEDKRNYEEKKRNEEHKHDTRREIEKIENKLEVAVKETKELKVTYRKQDI